jgi:hypothetical protein
MKHFEFYPKINYSSEQAVNILVRGKIRNTILKNIGLYYKYAIRDGDRPDILATRYYGNPSYTWAVFYANDMFHPVLDWPLDSKNFNKYLESKYGSVKNTHTKAPHHYEYYDQDLKKYYVIDKATYLEYSSDKINPKQVRPVSIYDYEIELNEHKRNIVILDKEYVQQITNELEVLFK